MFIGVALLFSVKNRFNLDLGGVKIYKRNNFFANAYCNKVFDTIKTIYIGNVAKNYGTPERSEGYRI